MFHQSTCLSYIVPYKIDKEKCVLVVVVYVRMKYIVRVCQWKLKTVDYKWNVYYWSIQNKQNKNKHCFIYNTCRALHCPLYIYRKKLRKMSFIKMYSSAMNTGTVFWRELSYLVNKAIPHLFNNVAFSAFFYWNWLWLILFQTCQKLTWYNLDFGWDIS